MGCARRAAAVTALLASAGAATTPRLSASFYNLWASQLDWTAEQWEEDLGYMQAIGIEWAFVT